jgi:tol-pal system protein YbgF
MLTAACPPNLLPAMIRSALLSVAVLACMLRADAAGAQDSSAELVTRIDRLEAVIRNLTGNIEQLQYRNQQLEQQVQRLQAEMQAGAPPATSAAPPRPTAQYSPPAAVMPPAVAAAPMASPASPMSPRPQYSPPPAVSAPAVIAAAPIAPPAPIETAPPPSTTRRGDAFDPSLNPNAPGAPRPLGASTAATEPPPPVAEVSGGRQISPPLDLATPRGELPPPPPANTSATGAMQATLPPSNTARDEYDLAYGYVLRRDYAQAADAFRVFLRQYPSDRLAPEALYWLGESLFQQQRYRDAAESFLAVSTKYDTTSRAPEALLRLGESLAALGEKEAACASLGEVLRKYPRAPQNIKQTVERDQKRGRC